jgi:hypothetical protein
LDPLVDAGFPVSACSIRCSSMRCKHPFKKSISRACWLTQRGVKAEVIVRIRVAGVFNRAGNNVATVSASSEADSEAMGLIVIGGGGEATARRVRPR